MAKVNISMDDELLKKMDECADARYMSRSTFISMCITDKITQIEAVKTLSLVADTLEKISKSDLTSDVQKEVDDLVTTSKMLLLSLGTK